MSRGYRIRWPQPAWKDASTRVLVGMLRGLDLVVVRGMRIEREASTASVDVTIEPLVAAGLDQGGAPVAQ